MANDASVIREFLVQLGFSLDSTSQKKFTDGISLADKAVLGITASLAGFTAALLATTNGMERLYFASQRTQASVAGIKSFQYAITNLGGSADDALGSIEGIAKFIRSNPGGEGFIGALGVGTRNSAGQLRDTVDILSDLGKQFAAMPYYQASKRASLLGIDEKTLQALIKGVGQFSDEYRKMSQDIGFDSDKAAGTSHAFMVQLRGLRGELGLLSDKFFAAFAEKLTPVIERARKWIEQNAGLISRSIDKIVEVLGVLAKLVGAVISRAIDIFLRLKSAFDALDPSTKSVAEAIVGIGVALAGLNLILSASPVGILFALAAGLLALYDDYKTWQEGGKSLIDWSQWGPEIDLAKKGIGLLGEGIHNAAVAFEWLGSMIQRAWAELNRFGNTLNANPMFHDILQSGQNVGKGIVGGVGNAISYLRGLGGSSAPSGADGGNQPTNPGNIRNGPGGAITNYASPAAGLQALGRQLNLYATGKSKNTGGRSLDTIQDIISTYAPSSENDTGAYIADVSKRLGVSPTAHLNLQDADTLASLMRGIVNHEQGHNPYSNDQYRTAANAALGAGAATVNQETTININGAGNPSEVANRTATAQNVVNQRLARNLSTAAQ